MTNSLLANWELKPRAEIAQSLESIWATCRPGTSRNASATVVAPERRMSSLLKTKMAAAASSSFSSFLETEVTLRLTRSSRERSATELVEGEPASAAQTPSVTSNINPAKGALFQNCLNRFPTPESILPIDESGFIGVGLIDNCLSSFTAVFWFAAHPAVRALCGQALRTYRVWAGTQLLRQARHVEQ